MPAKKVKCPICESPMKKGENEIPLKNNMGKIKILHGYRCTRCGYTKVG